MSGKRIKDAGITKNAEGRYDAHIDWVNGEEHGTDTDTFDSFDEANQWLIEQEAPAQTDVAPTSKPIDTEKLDDPETPAVGSGGEDPAPTASAATVGGDPNATAETPPQPDPAVAADQEAASTNLQADNEQKTADQEAKDQNS